MRRLLFLFIAIGLCVLALPAGRITKVQGQGGTPDPNLWYRVIVQHSGQCLDVQFGSSANGTNMIQHPCHLGDNQKFRFQPTGDGHYNIVTGNALKCVDQKFAIPNNGGLIIQHQCHQGDNQRWAIIPDGTGFNELRVKHSGKNMDVANASYTPSAQIIQYDPHGGINQKWRLEQVPAPCIVIDNDNDGWNACSDCDDNDPNVNPGAGACEPGVDRNCNGIDDYQDCFGGGECCFF
jgi:Ricin-type beta-trefoil lectin domain